MLMGQGKKYLLFSLFGTQVFAQSSILILLVFYILLGSGQGAAGIINALVFAAIAFFSILVHEVGHAMMVRRLGLGKSQIILHGLGGLTFWQGTSNKRQRILVALSGPLAGLALGGVTLIFTLALGFPKEFLLSSIVQALLWINLGWSLVNLLPVWPLDGGQIMRTALTGRRRSGTDAALLSLKVSMVAAGAVVLLSFAFRLIFVAVLFGMLLWSNYNELKQLKGPPESYYGY